MEQAVPDPPRFRSQAFSTSQRFPGKIELRGLVSCRSRPGFSFRVFPSQGSCSPLGVTSSPAVPHRRASVHRPPPYHPRFHRRPRSRAVAWIPRRLWVPFSRARARFPVALGHGQRNHLVPPAQPTSEPCSPCESVHDRRRCFTTPAADTLLVVPPLQSTTDHTSGSRTRPSLAARTRHAHPQLGRADDTRDPAAPRPGEASPPTEANDSTCSTASGPLRDRPAPPLDDVLAPLTFEADGEPPTLASEASKCVDSDESRETRPLSWGFSPLRRPRGFKSPDGPSSRRRLERASPRTRPLLRAAVSPYRSATSSSFRLAGRNRSAPDGWKNTDRAGRPQAPSSARCSRKRGELCVLDFRSDATRASASRVRWRAWGGPQEQLAKKTFWQRLDLVFAPLGRSRSHPGPPTRRRSQPALPAELELRRARLQRACRRWNS